ncbi:MAG: radical SAM protein [Candidatus Lernaella stagnicola]|nr:radical SAM protein [Candidatus Lernaella stagnicola]
MNRRRRATAFWRGTATVDAPPASLAIETTTCCNLECVGCLRQWDSMPAGHMDATVYEAALAWPGIESVLLYGLGEPLLDPDIFDRIAAARARGLFVQLSTNGTLLDEHRRASLLDAQPHVVIVSLDAADAETYRRVRGEADFNAVTENLRAFAAAAAPRGIACIVQMVLLPENRDRVDHFRSAFASLPGVTLRFKADETLPRRQAAQHRRAGRVCPVLFAGPTFIRVDGSVLPCCHMLEEEPLGRVGDVDPDALWHHERLRELRVLHGAGRIEEIAACNRCSLPLPPRSITATALLLPPRVFRRLLPFVERLLR